jgi:hypothetical protein
VRDYSDEGIDPETGLGLRERACVDHYLLTLNKTAAYRAAGYAADTYDAARQAAVAFFKRPHIQSYTDERIRERNRRLKVSADVVLQEACVVAFSRITDFKVNQDTGEVEVKPGRPAECIGAVRSVQSTKVPTGNHLPGTRRRPVDQAERPIPRVAQPAAAPLSPNRRRRHRHRPRGARHVADR